MRILPPPPDSCGTRIREKEKEFSRKTSLQTLSELKIYDQLDNESILMAIIWALSRTENSKRNFDWQH